MPEIEYLSPYLVEKLMDLVDEYGLLYVQDHLRRIYKDRYCDNCGHIKPE